MSDEDISPAEWRALVLDIIKDLRGEIKDVRSDVKDVRKDIQDMKKDEADFRASVIERILCGDHEIKQDVTTIKATDEALKSANANGRNWGATFGTIATASVAIILKILGLI